MKKLPKYSGHERLNFTDMEFYVGKSIHVVVGELRDKKWVSKCGNDKDLFVHDEVEMLHAYAVNLLEALRDIRQEATTNGWDNTGDWSNEIVNMCNAALGEADSDG